MATKIRTYTLEELVQALTVHGSSVKSITKGVTYTISNFDDIEINIEGFQSPFDYEEFSYRFVWSDDNSPCGISTDTPTPTTTPPPAPTPHEERQEMPKEMSAARLFHRHQSEFAFKQINEDTYKKVQIAGYVGELLIIGYRDNTGAIKDFSNWVKLDRANLFSTSYDLVTCQDITFTN